jgi:hypothetical protein
MSLFPVETGRQHPGIFVAGDCPAKAMKALLLGIICFNECTTGYTMPFGETCPNPKEIKCKILLPI